MNRETKASSLSRTPPSNSFRTPPIFCRRRRCFPCSAHCCCYRRFFTFWLLLESLTTNERQFSFGVHFNATTLNGTASSSFPRGVFKYCCFLSFLLPYFVLIVAIALIAAFLVVRYHSCCSCCCLRCLCGCIQFAILSGCLSKLLRLVEVFIFLFALRVSVFCDIFCDITTPSPCLFFAAYCVVFFPAFPDVHFVVVSVVLRCLVFYFFFAFLLPFSITITAALMIPTIIVRITTIRITAIPISIITINILLSFSSLSDRRHHLLQAKQRGEAGGQGEGSGLTSGIKSLCIPFDQPPMPEGTNCFFRKNQKAKRWAMFGRSY